MAIKYQLKQGDCIYCIAEKYGVMAETIWNHPSNVQIKEERKNPNMLSPGDIIILPDKRIKEVREQTNQVYKFTTKWKNHQHWIEIELIDDDDKPISNKKYMITLPDGTLKEGTLDQNGWARVEAIPNGTCEVTFPEIDEKAWKLMETVGPNVK